jgi:hypothetical protein
MSAPPPPPPGYNPQFVPAAPPHAPAPPPPGIYPWAHPGYVVPPAARPLVKHTSHTRLIAMFAVGLLVIVGGFLLITKLATPSAAKAGKCPPTCPQPPVGAPVSALPKFTAKDGSFSVAYYPSNSRVSVKTDASSITEKITPANGEDGTIVLLGQKADGRTAEQVVAALVAKAFPDAERADVSPNATVGYESGYGEIEDVYPQTTSGDYSHQRVIVMAAVKHDVALVAVAGGPYHEFSQDGLTDGHASGANVFVAFLLDRLLNSFTWKGDAPR